MNIGYILTAISMAHRHEYTLMFYEIYYGITEDETVINDPYDEINKRLQQQRESIMRKKYGLGHGTEDQTILQMLNEGKSISEIAKKIGHSYDAVNRRVNNLERRNGKGYHGK